MTYVEKMSKRIGAEATYHVYNHAKGIKIIRQIIADTKKACRIAILDEVDAPYSEKQAYRIAIDDAEVKE